MGNVLLRGVVHRHGRRIKIMKADGSVIKLRSPLSVKEILIDYPNHEMFEAPAGPPLGMGRLSRPLPERAGLVCGHLYYLIPLPFPEDQLMNYNNNSNREPFTQASSRSVPSASCRLEPPSYAGTATDSRKQEKEVDPVVNMINRSGVRVVSSSYSTDGSAVRVKLRLRKEELASFLSANNILMKNGVAPTIVQQATRQSASLPWKPSLDTIAEPYSLLADS